MDQQTRRFEPEEEQSTQRLEYPEAPAQPAVRPCPKCGDEMVEVTVDVPGRSGGVLLKRPGVWTGLLSGGASVLTGYSCLGCGFTELYAKDPGGLMRRE